MPKTKSDPGTFFTLIMREIQFNPVTGMIRNALVEKEGFIHLIIPKVCIDANGFLINIPNSDCYINFVIPIREMAEETYTDQTGIFHDNTVHAIKVNP